MTTTVLVHNGHRSVRVITEDRVWDAEKKALSDDWKEASTFDVPAGQLFQTYCTDTRRLVIVEPALVNGGLSESVVFTAPAPHSETKVG